MERLVDLVYCEFLKLKRSKIFFICILGATVAPLMEYVEYLKFRADGIDKVITYTGYFDAVTLYALLLIGLMVYGVIISHIFSREYTENTLKTILTVPVSKVKFIISKFIMFYLWTIILILVTWLTTLFVGAISGAEGLSANVLLHSLWNFCYGSTLDFLVLTPFVFITLYFKNMIPTIISLTAIVMVNIALSNESISVLFPWYAPYIIVMKKVGEYGYSSSIPYLGVLIVSLIGFALSCFYFVKKDVR